MIEQLCRDLLNSSYHTKVDSIIVLLFVQNISRALKETKCTLLMRNLKINEISISLAFCVFLLSLSFNISTLFNVSNLQSAALSGSAVPKPLLRDVNHPIIFQLLDD